MVREAEGVEPFLHAVDMLQDFPGHLHRRKLAATVQRAQFGDAQLAQGWRVGDRGDATHGFLRGITHRIQASRKSLSDRRPGWCRHLPKGNTFLVAFSCILGPENFSVKPSV